MTNRGDDVVLISYAKKTKNKILKNTHLVPTCGNDAANIYRAGYINCVRGDDGEA